MQTLGIYIHIPFCVRKCHYCDFLSFETADHAAYVKALIDEIGAFDAGDAIVDTIFFGGGTPSVLPARAVEEILSAVQAGMKVASDAEITMEANPKTFDEQKARAWRHIGINRLSIGVQSTDDRLLHLLGRIHTAADFHTAMQTVRRVGFDNVNVDIMAGLPRQTLENYRKNLYDILKTQPEHISSYGLIIEEGTPFFHSYADGAPLARDLPAEDTVNAMYELTGETLAAAGYERYEISNYAVKDRACRHNIKYWTRAAYKGFGLGAASFLRYEEAEYRLTNTRDMAAYLRGETVTEREVIAGTDRENEVIFTGLRMTAGIDLAAVSRDLAPDWLRRRDVALKKLMRDGLIRMDGGLLRLTTAGLTLSNYVMGELFL